MVDLLLGAAAVLVSLAIALGVIRLNYGRPPESRGLTGLAATVAHLLLSLLLPAALWVVYRPQRPLVFVVSVLAFYWVSLIILVLAIIRWLRSGTKPQEASPADQNPRHQERL